MAEAAESNISFSSYFKSFSDTLTSSAFPQLYVMLQDIKKDAQKRDEADKEKRQRDGGTSNKILSDDLREIQTTLEEMNVILEASRDEHIKTNQLLERLLVDGGKGGGIGGGGGGGGGGNTLLKEAEELAVYEVLKKSATKLLPILGRSLVVGGSVLGIAGAIDVMDNEDLADPKVQNQIQKSDAQKNKNFEENGWLGGSWENLKESFGFGGPSKSEQFELGDKYVDNAIKNEKTKLEGFTKQYEEEQKVVAGLAAEIERQKKDGQDVTENQKLLLKLQETLADDLKLKTESEKTLFELQKAKDNAPVPGVPNIPNITDQGVQKNPDGTVQDSSGRTILQTAKPFTFEDSIKGMEAPTIHNNSIVSGTNKTNNDVSELQKRIGVGNTQEDKEFVKHSSAEARMAAEKYLGRSMSDSEYHNLIKATHAEAGGGKIGNQKEEAMVMASIINRARKLGPDGINKALTAPNQFQSVTGTKYDHSPSSAFIKGPQPQRQAAIESAAVEHLEDIPHNQTDFTAASSKAYGPGTTIGYRDKMLAKGGQIIGGSVFNTNPEFKNHPIQVADIKNTENKPLAYNDEEVDSHIKQLITKADKIVDDTKQFSDDRMISKPEDQEQLYKTAWSDNMKYGDGNQGVPGQSSGDFDPSNNPLNDEGKDRRQWHIGTLPNQDQIAHNLLSSNNPFGDLSGSMESVHGDVDSNLSTQLLKESFDNSVEDHGRHKDNNQVQKQFTDDKSVQDHGFHKDKTDKTDTGVVSPPDHVLQKLFTTPPS